MRRPPPSLREPHSTYYLTNGLSLVGLTMSASSLLVPGNAGPIVSLLGFAICVVSAACSAFTRPWHVYDR